MLKDAATTRPACPLAGAFKEGKWVQRDGSIFKGTFDASLPVSWWWFELPAGRCSS
jgi:hypothetical protein